MRKAMIGAALLWGAAGCVGVVRSVPTEQLVDSQVTVRQAEEAGAAQNEEAAQHLDWARQQTLGARRLLEANRRDEAALFLKRAAADAELALALAREAPARAEADRLLEQVRQLQQDSVQ
jgi:aminoglycoside phosphotransferase